MSSIDKPKGEKYWKITFYRNKKRYRRSLGVESKREAQKLKSRIDLLMLDQRFDPNDIFGSLKKEKMLYEAIDEYIWYIDSRKDLSDTTKYNYRYSVSVLLKQFLKDTPLKDIRRSVIEFELRPSLERHFKAISTVRHHMLDMTMFC